MCLCTKRNTKTKKKMHFDPKVLNYSYKSFVVLKASQILKKFVILFYVLKNLFVDQKFSKIFKGKEKLFGLVWTQSIFSGSHTHTWVLIALVMSKIQRHKNKIFWEKKVFQRRALFWNTNCKRNLSWSDLHLQ